MARDIGEWLDGLGLGRYAEAFADNEIDLRALPHITEQDLKEIGVALGARRKLLAAIAELGDSDEPATADERPEERSASAEAERRQLTVMFVDLVGSTALSERLDPEDLREVLRAYQQTCAEAVGRFEGHIAKYIGDGLLVYFGYPQAHEDDARRAVSAGLGIVEGLEMLNRRLGDSHGVELSVRVGVHTGLVVAGEMGGGETHEAQAIVGETPNIAARLEALAAPNNVAISAATQSLVEGLFECDDLGPRHLKGVSHPVTIFRIRGQSAAQSHFEAAAERGLTPLVGRESEIGLLGDRWAQAREGEAQVVLLSGEAGVGKSRILRAFRERLEGEPHNRVLYYGSAYHRNSALYPAINQLERALRFARDEGPAGKIDKLEAVLNGLGLPLADTAPILASLLSLPLEGRYEPLELVPQQLKAKTLEASIAVFAAMAAQVPLLMVVEDAHWIDPSTVELLSLAIDRLPASRLLLLITFRPEFPPPWAGRANVTQLALNRLGRKDAAAMVANVTGGKALPREVLDQIIARTDGVPLYVEELTNAVLESGLLSETDQGYALTGPLPALAIPSSLQDSLMARLDRLAPVKEVAQLAATIGRGFSHELLAAVSPLSDAEINNALDKLVDSGLVYRRGVAPLADYEFKHALVRDAAYESLLKSTRQTHHSRIAEVLAERFAAIAAAEPEVLAHHYSEAGLHMPAAQGWLRAGQRAIERSANAEVLAHATRGLEVVAALPEGRERDTLEMRLRLMAGPSNLTLKGNTSPEVKAHYTRASALADEVGGPADRFMAAWGLWIYEVQSGRHDASQGLVQELLAAAEDQSDPGLLLQAHHCAWTTLYALDDLPATLAHAREGMAVYDFDRHRGHAFLYAGHDPGVCAYMHAGMAQWQLGFADQALAAAREAVALSTRLGHRFSEVIATFGTAWLNQYLGAAPTVQILARSMAETCEKNGFPHYQVIARIFHGWALAEQDRCAEGIAEIEKALKAYRASGAVVRLSYYISLLAEAHVRASAPERALEALNEALEVIEETGERRWEAEVNRLKAEQLLTLSPGDTAGAQQCLQRALDVARGQEAKSLELRAATSLARLWRTQNKRAEACSLLAPVYGWFTEGFETPDLKDAKALLDELT